MSCPIKARLVSSLDNETKKNPTEINQSGLNYGEYIT